MYKKKSHMSIYLIDLLNYFAKTTLFHTLCKQNRIVVNRSESQSIIVNHKQILQFTQFKIQQHESNRCGWTLYQIV